MDNQTAVPGDVARSPLTSFSGVMDDAKRFAQILPLHREFHLLGNLSALGFVRRARDVL